MPADTFFITGDAEADKLLHDDPLALLLGMLLDQQVPMEWAFIGILFCSAVGIGFGMLPAIRAARLNPIDALRYE